MRFDETQASKARWAEYAAPLFDGWDILAEDTEVDYQGHAALLATKDGAYRFIHWEYGSCSGCDGWEDLPEERIREDMARLCMTADSLGHLICTGGYLSKLVKKVKKVTVL